MFKIESLSNVTCSLSDSVFDCRTSVILVPIAICHDGCKDSHFRLEFRTLNLIYLVPKFASVSSGICAGS